MTAKQKGFEFTGKAEELVSTNATENINGTLRSFENPNTRSTSSERSKKCNHYRRNKVQRLMTIPRAVLAGIVFRIQSPLHGLQTQPENPSSLLKMQQCFVNCFLSDGVHLAKKKIISVIFTRKCWRKELDMFTPVCVSIAGICVPVVSLRKIVRHFSATNLSC